MGWLSSNLLAVGDINHTAAAFAAGDIVYEHF